MLAIAAALVIVILGAAPVRLGGRVLAIAGAALLLVWVAAISAVVFGEDTYVSDGSSRWENRDAREHTLYLVTAGVAVAVAAMLALLAIRDAAALQVRKILLLAGIAAFVAGLAVVVSFSSN